MLVTGLTSAAGVISQLDEKNNDLKHSALITLNHIIDCFWHEISDHITTLELINEDEDLPIQTRQLASLVVSKVYFHLGSYQDSMEFAIKAGPMFSSSEDTEYVRKILATALDEYIAQNYNSGGTGNVNPHLKKMIEDIFDSALARGEYREAIGHSLECHRLDLFRKALTESPHLTENIAYSIRLCTQSIKPLQWTNEVLKAIIEFEPTTADLFHCLILLNDTVRAAAEFEKLLMSEELIAYQFAFILYQDAPQKFRENLVNQLTILKVKNDRDKIDQVIFANTENKLLPSLINDATAKAKSASENNAYETVTSILNGKVPTNLHRFFLHSWNNTDPEILRDTLDHCQRSGPMMLVAMVIEHAFMNAGTNSMGFLREEGELTRKLRNWNKFTCVASIGNVNYRNEEYALRALERYLPVLNPAPQEDLQDLIDDLHDLSDEEENAGYLSDEEMDAEHLSDEGGDAEHVSDEEVDAEHLSDEEMDAEHLSDEEGDAEHVSDEEVDAEHLSDEEVDVEHLSDEEVDAEHVSDEEVDTEHLSNEEDAEHLSVEEDAEHLSDEEDAEHLSDEEDAEHLSDEEDAEHLSDEEDAEHLSDEEDAEHLNEEVDAEHLCDEERDTGHLSDEEDAEHLSDDGDESSDDEIDRLDNYLAELVNFIDTDLNEGENNNADLFNEIGASAGYKEGGALFALGLIHANRSSPDMIKIFMDNIAASTNTVITHGACLGLGITAMGLNQTDILATLEHELLNDDAVSGEAAGIALGLVQLGNFNDGSAIERILEYAKQTAHEKVLRGIAVGIPLMCFGQEEKANDVINRLISDKENAILRRAGAMSIGMAYCGTGDNNCIKKLLQIAVTDNEDDVRRVAAIALGFVLCGDPESSLSTLQLIEDSYNPHVRYGVALALGIACAGTGDLYALKALKKLTEDTEPFVRQGALIASALILVQENETNPKFNEFNQLYGKIIRDRYAFELTKFGAVLAQGILNGGGRNVTITCKSRAGHIWAQGVVGLFLFTHYWYWYPMALCLPMSFAPTCMIAVNKNLKVPELNFISKCKPSLFAFPKPFDRSPVKAEKQRIADAFLSITIKHLAKRSKISEDEIRQMTEDLRKLSNDKTKPTKPPVDQSAEPSSPEHEPNSYVLGNPARCLKQQLKYLEWGTNTRWEPVAPILIKRGGFVVVKDRTPEAEVIEVQQPSCDPDLQMETNPIGDIYDCDEDLAEIYDMDMDKEESDKNEDLDVESEEESLSSDDDILSNSSDEDED